MGRLFRAHWEPRLDTFGLPRAERRGCWYDAYAPDELSRRTFVLDGQSAADIADAERAIIGLDKRATVLVDTGALARLLLRAEAVASSRIEGLAIGARRLLQADAARDTAAAARDVGALEILANIDAMAYAIDAVAEGAEIRLEHLLEMHRRLLATSLPEHAGKLRSVQNWIGGNDYNPCNAAFIPPPPELVERLLNDLCEFCNDDALSPAAQAAIAHAQFETIHPFVDGNGRVGRALIHMVLRRRGLTKHVLPPISLALATNSRGYIDALRQTRNVGDPASTEATTAMNRWLALFGASCVRSVLDAERFEDRVIAIQESWRARLPDLRAHSTVFELIRVLPGAPIISAGTAATLVHRSIPSVNEALTHLVQAGILRQTTAQARNRVFEAPDIIEAFTDLERGLASPIGDTISAPPVRPVPARRIRKARSPR